MASITPINTLIAFHGVLANAKNSAQCYQMDFPPIFPAGHETTTEYTCLLKQ